MATTFVCPKGDQSDDAEFCSVCGIKMGGPGPGPDSQSASPGAADRCPGCGAERKNGGRFCETCRYDFKSQAPGPAPVVITQPVDPPPASPPPPPSPATPSTAQAYWEAVLTVDPTLDVEPDPDTPCPTDTPERSFPLDLPENLVGRRSASRGIFPQVPLTDPGVSHRHLMVYRNPDGSLAVSDLGSTNGSFVNGNAERLEPGIKTPVAETDRVELGRWTRLTFRQRTA